MKSDSIYSIETENHIFRAVKHSKSKNIDLKVVEIVKKDTPMYLLTDIKMVNVFASEIAITFNDGKTLWFDHNIKNSWSDGE